MQRSIAFKFVLLTLALLATMKTPAHAGLTGKGQIRDDSIEAGVSSDGTSPSRSTDTSPSEIVCTTKPINPNMEGIFRVDEFGKIVALFDETHREDQGNWYRETCIRNFRLVSQRMFWLANVDPTDLAKQALGTAQLPKPTIAIAQTLPAVTYVNMDTWLWIDSAAWKSVTATASADGLTVTVTATPYAVVWNSGDPRAETADRSLTCRSAGKPFNYNLSLAWQSSDCTYRYLHTSGKQPDLAFLLGATLQWHATWTATNGTSGDLGLVSTTSTIPIKVGEVQALNVYPNGGP